jgi:uncharacterized membrane protein YesL
MTRPAARRQRGRWLDTVAGGADVALAGMLAGLAALPVVTAGAAAATVSHAMHAWIRDGTWPGLAQLWRVFRRGLLPGLGATVCGLVGAGLLAADLAALRSGRVPGGGALVTATVAVAAVAVGLACLTVVEAGRRGGGDWHGSLRWALHTAVSRPWLVVAQAAVLGFAVVLASMVPPLALLLPGPVLYAMHAVARPR